MHLDLIHNYYMHIPHSQTQPHNMALPNISLQIIITVLGECCALLASRASLSSTCVQPCMSYNWNLRCMNDSANDNLLIAKNANIFERKGDVGNVYQ